MRVGLTLGKFAPLHAGHQYLIETALSQVDHLIVMIYHSPEHTKVPLGKRAQWVHDLYPQVEVIEASDGPMTIGDTPEIQAMHEHYILGKLNGRRITHFLSSEFYGEHMSRALGAHDVRVDEPRQNMPISATQIRADLFANRHWLHPRVYRDLVSWVLFLGAPSTGKTTLAKALAKRLDTVWMPEYGREYWEAHQQNRRLTPSQLVYIAEEHRRREEKLVHDARGTFFVDTSALTTYHFALDYHGDAEPRLSELAKQSLCRYDHIFVCEDDIPYDNTWDRSGPAHRREAQQRLKRHLEDNGTPYLCLSGDLETRMTAVLATLIDAKCIEHGVPA